MLPEGLRHGYWSGIPRRDGDRDSGKGVVWTEVGPSGMVCGVKPNIVQEKQQYSESCLHALILLPRTFSYRHGYLIGQVRIDYSNMSASFTRSPLLDANQILPLS